MKIIYPFTLQYEVETKNENCIIKGTIVLEKTSIATNLYLLIHFDGK